MKKTAVIFPGQGSQYVGMGREFLDRDGDARALMETAREVSGFPLQELCIDGPIEDLTRALHLQPALTVTNLICWQQLRKALPTLRPACFAGHSLGEYSALCAAGIVSPGDCLALVTRRGELMEREGRSHPGGMRAVLGLTCEQLESLLAGYAGGGRVALANHNSEKQVVISGDMEGLDGLGALCRNDGAKVIPLQVSIANHSPLVAGAVEDFAAFMAGITFRPPVTPVLFNVTAAGEDEPAVIRDIMASQIISRVRWFDTVHAMLAAGVEVFVEAGPRTVLTGLLKKIVPRDRAVCVQFDTPEGLDKIVAAIMS